MAKIGVIDYEVYTGKVADKCPHCRSMCELKLHIYQKVFVLGIPFFPTDKTVKIECTNCDERIYVKDAPEQAVAKYKQQLALVKPPKWAYSGLFFLGFALIFGLIYIPIKNNNMKDYINDPHIGDRYEMKYDDASSLFNKDMYTYYRVASFTSTTIKFQTFAYEAGSSAKLAKVLRKDEDEIWLDETITYSKSELFDLIPALGEDLTSEIYDIDRLE